MTILTKKIIKNITSLIINEYKFYVDFKGLLYFQDTRQYIYPNAIKDKKFIGQLYQNLTPTTDYFQRKIKQQQEDEIQLKKQQKDQSQEYKKNKNYPFVAQFWGQRNFVKCGIAPIIYTRILKASQLENAKLSNEQKQQQYLEFSFGQYSLFNVKEICIDDSGQLWHPFIRIKQQKQKKQVDVQNTKIMGVFSNELVSQMLDKIKYENDEPFLQYKGVKNKISKKITNSNKSSKFSQEKVI